LLRQQKYHITYIARNGQGQERYGEILRKMGVEVYATDRDMLRRMGYNPTSAVSNEIEENAVILRGGGLVGH
jgi:hypothetical protein